MQPKYVHYILQHKQQKQHKIPRNRIQYLSYCTLPVTDFHTRYSYWPLIPSTIPPPPPHTHTHTHTHTHKDARTHAHTHQLVYSLATDRTALLRSHCEMFLTPYYAENGAHPSSSHPIIEQDLLGLMRPELEFVSPPSYVEIEYVVIYLIASYLPSYSDAWAHGKSVDVEVSLCWFGERWRRRYDLCRTQSEKQGNCPCLYMTADEKRELLRRHSFVKGKKLPAMRPISSN
jgi:hypothetical protein